ncbi:MAG: lipoprotein insertase outer membrane protein LolB [Burkholderiales bacterium]
MRFAAIVALLLCGCAAVPNKTPSYPPSREQSLLSARQNGFELSGRVAVKYDAKNFSGGVRWTHRNGADEIWILAPLGRGVAHIVRDSAGITLTTDDQKTYQAKDAESLTRAVLGWSLPLSGLQYWVLGVAAPYHPARQQNDAQGRLLELNQDEWQIAYPRYKPAAESGMPGRIQLSRDDLNINLVIDDWIIASP